MRDASEGEAIAGAAVKTATVPVEVRTGIGPDEWDSMVAAFADAAHEQTQAFRGAVWGESRVQRVAVLRSGKIVGLALAVAVLAGPLKRGMAYIKFGPLWRRKGEIEDPGTLAEVLTALVEEFTGRQKLGLNILPAADPRYAGLFRDELNKLGFARRDLPDPNRYLVKLTLDEAKQRASLSQKWRYNLKKSLACDLSVGIEDGNAALESFDAMFAEMERRKKYKNDSWDLVYPRLRAGFPEAIRPTVVIVREAGEPIAGAVIGHIGDTAYYLYGATTDRATAIKAGYAMHWWIVNWLHGRGLYWYELGGEAFEPGLRQFKKGFIGREGAMAPLAGEFSLCRDPLSRMVSGAIAALRIAREWKKKVAAGGFRLKPVPAAAAEEKAEA